MKRTQLMSELDQFNAYNCLIIVDDKNSIWHKNHRKNKLSSYHNYKTFIYISKYVYIYNLYLQIYIFIRHVIYLTCAQAWLCIINIILWLRMTQEILFYGLSRMINTHL